MSGSTSYSPWDESSPSPPLFLKRRLRPVRWGRTASPLWPYNHTGHRLSVESTPLSSFITYYTHDIITGGDSLAKWTAKRSEAPQKPPPTYLYFIHEINYTFGMLQWTAARWMNGQILSSTAIKCRVPQKGSKSRLQSTLRACQRSKYVRKMMLCTVCRSVPPSSLFEWVSLSRTSLMQFLDASSWPRHFLATTSSADFYGR